MATINNIAVMQVPIYISRAPVDLFIILKKRRIIMSHNNRKNYLWIIEWNNPFASPGKKKGMLYYNVTPHAGVTQEDFEKFMKKEAFPAIGMVSTRSINFGPQYLLLENAGEGSRDV